MKTAFSTVALSATLTLHVALVAAVVTGLSIHQDKQVEQSAIAVQLLPPAAPTAPPVPLPMAAAPEPPQPEQKRPQPKRIPKPKPAPRPRETPTREAQLPARPAESKPASPDTSAPTQAPATAPEATTAPSAPAAPPGPAAPPAPPVNTGVSIPASYAASNRKPDYPALSRRYEEQGTVVLQVLVKADGTAGEVKLKSSSGHPLLDKSAMSTVQSWRFIPAIRDGKPVAEWYPVPITFTLQN